MCGRAHSNADYMSAEELGRHAAAVTRRNRMRGGADGGDSPSGRDSEDDDVSTMPVVYDSQSVEDLVNKDSVSDFHLSED